MMMKFFKQVLEYVFINLIKNRKNESHWRKSMALLKKGNLSWLFAIFMCITMITNVGCEKTTDTQTKGGLIFSVYVDVEVESAEENEAIRREIAQINSAATDGGFFDYNLYVKLMTERFGDIRLQHYDSVKDLEVGIAKYSELTNESRARKAQEGMGTETVIRRCCTCYAIPACGACSSGANQCYYHATTRPVPHEKNQG